VGAGLLFWQHERHFAAVVAFSGAALTRETMLVAVAAVACWELVNSAGSVRSRVRRVAPLAVPPGLYLAWVGMLGLRFGSLPFDRSRGRLGLPGSGLLAGLRASNQPSVILIWVVVGVALCIGVTVYAHRDVLAWIAVAFGLFGSLLGPDVWANHAGFERTLLPLYAFASVALIGAVNVPHPRFRDAEIPARDPRERQRAIVRDLAGRATARATRARADEHRAPV
jgi:hypothetical protein